MMELNIDETNTPESINVLKKTEIYKNRFRALGTIEIGDKVGIDERTMCLYKEISYPYIQSVVRWYYGQSRDNLHTYLDTQFAEYMTILDRVLSFYNKDPHNEVYQKMVSSNMRILCNIVPGLHNLRLTYVDCLKIHNKLYSIILTLKDYYMSIQKIKADIVGGTPCNNTGNTQPRRARQLSF